MIDLTDRHCRYFLRLISKHAVLYTEMLTTGALLRGDRLRFLEHDQREHPLAIQLGGSDPQALAQCARLAEDAGYDEVNLNVGCPSDRVQSGRFGACLMAEPQLVADCVASMKSAVAIPVTVKCRLGIDEQDPDAASYQFIDTVRAAGCNTFILHARKAWLKGLSPRENREIPPLQYDIVYQRKRDFPELEIILNGGLTDLNNALTQLDQVDGVMLGREVYQNPYLLAEVDRLFYGDNRDVPSREAILDALLPYVETQLARGVHLKHISRHVLGLFHGVPGAKQWRRYLSCHAHLAQADVGTLRAAAALALRARNTG
jgi:tRNA-dihydrouridine synthase A